ncbi:unnamed protein product, partial [Meganyctiphanes norvegica]
MFTRDESTARTTSSAKGVALLKNSLLANTDIQIPVTSVIPVTTTITSDGSEQVIPSVSLTITAVATELDADGRITTTTEVPVLDTPTITNLVLNSLEGGLHCGVPTRTTPTLTPTTLRNIEQTFLELGGVPAPETHNNQAGFVPPLVQPNTSASTSGGTTFISLDQKCWGGGVATLTTAPTTSSSGSIVSTSSSATTSGLLPRQHPMYTSGALFNSNSNSSDASSTGSMPSVHLGIGQPGRRVGGRRPNREDHLTPEEEERRKQRRERNKMAAARCRKRRLDQTNCLQDETDDLEDKKSSLQQEIQLLQQQRDELEFLLATHKAVCRRKTQNNNNIMTTIPSTIVSAPSSITSVSAPSSITSVVTSANPIQVNPRNYFTNNNVTVQSLPLKEVSLKEEVVIKEEPQETQDDSVLRILKTAPTKPRRPTSLNVGPLVFRNSTVADLGVPIETPSAGLRGLNFESMMDGGTGLTPVTNGTGLTPLSTGLTPLTTPVVTAPSQSSSNCSSQQRSSSSDLSSPDSVVPPKLVSL